MAYAVMATTVRVASGDLTCYEAAPEFAISRKSGFASGIRDTGICTTLPFN
jgi:hypothetical protein